MHPLGLSDTVRRGYVAIGASQKFRRIGAHVDDAHRTPCDSEPLRFCVAAVDRPRQYFTVASYCNPDGFRLFAPLFSVPPKSKKRFCRAHWCTSIRGVTLAQRCMFAKCRARLRQVKSKYSRPIHTRQNAGLGMLHHKVNCAAHGKRARDVATAPILARAVNIRPMPDSETGRACGLVRRFLPRVEFGRISSAHA